MGKKWGILKIVFTFAVHLKFFTMATITFRLSTKPHEILKTTDKGTMADYQVLVRFRHGKTDQYGKTKVFAPREYIDDIDSRKNQPLWDEKRGGVIIPDWRGVKTPFQKQLETRLRNIDAQLTLLQNNIKEAFDEAGAGKTALSQGWLESLLNPSDQSPDEQPTNGHDLLKVFEDYICKGKFSEVRKTNYRVVWRILKRFSLYTGTPLEFDTITADTLKAFEQFLREEHTYYDSALERVRKASESGKKIGKTYLDIMETVPESRRPEPRGDNSVISTMKKLRAFFRWANGLSKEDPIEPYTRNNPFAMYRIIQEEYGTPYYITIEERNIIAAASLEGSLAVSRDIFVFQCCIGCRVSDLWAMKKANVINGAVEYIPRKTKDGRPVTVRVPLNKQAMEIYNRYKDIEGNRLLPFPSQPQYNRAIKAVFEVAGINRLVTVLNPTTKEEEKRPIYEVASSHMARRTFVGNLYKQVKDPNLVGKLSGHKEGSQAFARYRDIDEDMKKELVSLLD